MVSHFGALAQFTAGYVIILVTPGPNMLAVASTAALRGLRAALPFCIGHALGVGVLCATMAFASDSGRWGETGTARLAGAFLLASVALSSIRRRAVLAGPGGTLARAPADLVLLGGGLFTAATNPLTAAYFLSGFLGFSPTWHWRAAAIASVLAVALLAYPLLAAALARPALRSLALRRERAFRVLTAVLLALTAARTAWPVVFP